MFKYVLSHKENFRALSNPTDYRKFKVAPPELWVLWQGISEDNFLVKMHKAQKTAAHDAHFPASFIYIRLLHCAYSICSYCHICVIFKQVTPVWDTDRISNSVQEPSDPWAWWTPVCWVSLYFMARVYRHMSRSRLSHGFSFLSSLLMKHFPCK